MTTETTTWSQRYRPEPTVYEPREGYTVIHGAVEDAYLAGDQRNLIITDPPAVDEDMAPSAYVGWFQSILAHLDPFISDDAGLIVVPNNRKGHPWLKSDMTSYAISTSGLGWEMFRKYIWLPYEGDFHRSHYVHIAVYVFRRGNMPTNKGAALRYKDIIRVADRGGHDRQTVAPFPVELCMQLIELFLSSSRPLYTLDPFAGSGAVLRASQRLGLRSTAVELDDDRAMSILDHLVQGDEL